MVGANQEMLSLAHNLGLSVDLVVDPKLSEPEWRSLAACGSDAVAVELQSPDRVILAIDAPRARERAFIFYFDRDAEILNLCAETPGANTRHGSGLVVQRSAFLSCDCVIGDGVRLNVGARVMHDCILEDFVTIAPDAVVLSGVKIGKRAYVGANATILPGVTIGSDARIGAGAVVTRDVRPSETIVGPAAHNLK